MIEYTYSYVPISNSDTYWSLKDHIESIGARIENEMIDDHNRCAAIVVVYPVNIKDVMESVISLLT